ncbi:putative reticuline oxidase [Iris pallida]|uniref:Reticuline oxidase n=1 Tax=Iris pallida TaxID=29817 RepID=A0AAX6E087_IRIPA|nr:putative reticuline oxidase [Iris pallida]
MKLFLLLLSYFVSVANAAQSTNTTTTSLTSCLVSADVHNFSIATSSSYNHLLNFSIRNLRFVDPAIARPVAVVLPGTKHQLQSAVVCCINLLLSIRLRSGGHSYEGLSYTADGTNPFVVVDLMNLNRVRVNLTDSTAWVESGATIGEVYYAVADESGGSLAFPAGSCPTVGSGGQIAGGGYGYLSRKYGLAADNVLDAVLIDSAGRVLDRSSMGEDVFWAIRGGGGGSWGAIYAWKLRLVPVPDRVTTCQLSRSMPSRPVVAELVHKWQHVSPALPDDFYLSVTISATVNVTNSQFNVQFLGPISRAVSILARRFPELGLNESDCAEMSWVESAVRFAGLKSKSDLTDRSTSYGKIYSKSKSDYVRVPIPLSGLTGAFNWLAKEPKSEIFLEPYGGAMDRIPSHDVPFPHRRGNLYGIQYIVGWTKVDDGAGYKYVAWLREFYEYMARYVSKEPTRAAYVNCVDLDLGVVDWSGPDRDRAGAARVWGEKYFLGNYDRLVRAKTAIDPGNMFRHQQSIPPSTS